MKKACAVILLVLFVGACTPVIDPARWDGTMYCKTVQSLYGPEPGCK